MEHSPLWIVTAGTSSAEPAARARVETVAGALRERGHAAESAVVAVGHGATCLGALGERALLCSSGFAARDAKLAAALHGASHRSATHDWLGVIVASDALRTRELLRAANVPQPAFYVVRDAREASALGELHGAFGFPARVTARAGDMDYVVRGPTALAAAVGAILAEADQAVISAAPAGAVLTVAILRGKVLGVSAEAAPKLGARELDALSVVARRAASALDLSAAAEVELVVGPRTNELVTRVHALPRLMASAPFARAGRSAGFGFAELCEAVVVAPASRRSAPVRARTLESSPPEGVLRPGLAEPAEGRGAAALPRRRVG